MNEKQLREAVAWVQSLPAKRQAELTVIWTGIVDAIHTDMEARRPPVKVFEVHHSVDVARERFFYAVLAGWPDDLSRACALSVLPGRNPMGLVPPT